MASPRPDPPRSRDRSFRRDKIARRFGRAVLPDSSPGITHAKCRAGCVVRQLNGNTTVGKCVFQRIVDQVAQNRVQCLPVGLEIKLIRADNIKHHGSAVGNRCKAANNVVDNVSCVEQFEIENLLSGFDSGQLQHSQDQLEQSFGLFINLLEEAFRRFRLRQCTAEKCVRAGLNDRQRSLSARATHR